MPNQTSEQLEEKIRLKEQRILALEADKQDLIQQFTQIKQKHQTHLSQEKSFLQREIQLIKEALEEGLYD
jgi:RNase adaptor protein for sRNA GlmZ degradation